MRTEWKAILDEVKRIASTFAKPQKFEQATLEDGTIVEWEGELTTGASLFVVNGDERIPAPIGTHVTTDGTTVIVEEEGVVASATVAEAMNEEEVTVEEAPAVLESVSEIIDAELNIGMDKAFDIATKILKKINEQNSAEFAKISEVMESVVTKVSGDIDALRADLQAFKSTPQVTTSEKAKFSREGSNLTARQQFLINNLKK
jgi:DNA-directed RNA polymerase subunit F